jgi:hypothetical protein
MVGIFKRIYDWLLSLFWYVLLFCRLFPADFRLPSTPLLPGRRCSLSST